MRKRRQWPWPLLLLLPVQLALLSPSAADVPPDEIRSLIDAAGTTEDFPGANLVVVGDWTDVEVEDSGLSHILNHTVTKILTERGARDRAQVRFDYDPATQAVEIRQVNLYRRDGTLEAIDLSDLVDVFAPAHAIYWGGRMMSLALPRLEVGDAVEILTYRKGFQIAYLGDSPGEVADDDARYIPPMEGHFYDVVQFQGGAPLVEKTYNLRTPLDKPVQFSVYNGEVSSAVTFDETHFTYRFWKRDVASLKREWRSSGASDYAPKVVLATVRDWQEKSRWFWEANQNQFEDNEQIRAMVAEITRGARTDAEKIAAINHWVAQEIRYCGLNMGQGEGYTLHPGEMIFFERAGVCKDKAGMVITMLRSAGYEVYPAMTMAGSRVERIPADQFNHCVAALRKPDGSYELLDPTWIPFAMNNWSLAEGEQNYVIGCPEGEDLAITPAFQPEENRVQLQVRSRVQADGTLTAEVKVVAAGYADTRLRRSIGSAPRARPEAALERWVAALAPNAELLDFRFGDHRDFATPLTLSLEFRIPGYASVGDTRLFLTPCATRLVMANYGGLFRFAASNLPEERTTPSLIWYPQEVEISETIELPRGYRAAELAGDWQTGSGDDIASCTLNCQPGKKRVEITGTVRVERRTIPPDDWPAFQATVKMLEDFSQARLVAERKGA